MLEKYKRDCEKFKVDKRAYLESQDYIDYLKKSLEVCGNIKSFNIKN